MKKWIPSAIVVTTLLFVLIAASEGAVSGAKSALYTCGNLILPCLFPFFTVSYIASNLGLLSYLGQSLHKPMSILFGTSGIGGSIFLLGILGGYPSGAAIIADHIHRQELTAEEGSKLLALCNNSGPSFLIGAVGIGVFRSPAAGVLLYIVHILAALITGMFLSGTKPPDYTHTPICIASTNLSNALTEAISKAVFQLLPICGYIIFFGALIGALEEFGIFTAIYGNLALYTPLPLHLTKALCMGALELGCGIGALAECPLTPQSLTLCSLLTGFGGVSVCLQTAGVISGSGIKLRYHILGRICCGGIGAFLMYTISSFLF